MIADFDPPPILPLEVDKEDTREITPVEWGAKKLAEHFRGKVPKWSDFTDCSPPVAKSRVHAAASGALRYQELSVEKSLELFQQMQRSGHWEGILWLEHVLFDETPLTVRVSFGDSGKDKQLVKLFMVERRWSMLIRKAGGDTAGTVDREQLCLLEGCYSPGVRGAANTTGDTICKLLGTFPEPASHLLQNFKVKVRCVECDEACANLRAESLVLNSRAGSEWCWLFLVCLGHKIHASASKTWPLQKNVISALVHTSKHLNGGGAMATLKKSLSELAIGCLQVLPPRELTHEAETYRRQLIDLFAPPTSEPHRRASFNLVASFLNGDWRLPKTLIHHCPGQHCCKGRDHAVGKIVSMFQHLLTKMRPRILNRANWASWSDAFRFYGLLGIHTHSVRCLSESLWRSRYFGRARCRPSFRYGG